ncbi:hypothetical protein MICAG_3100005 [Microcystis aeruginosa PCC 9808]|uniref:Uncharacterized protein n=1 Tax=Microcystis aeruginosa PCC 9808 TaxID=1160284 RepID=I4HWS7_MICAE|nr:hypothetical protein MICAG_3100005 [Microcystis aeruginosa PCC 9808]
MISPTVGIIRPSIKGVFSREYKIVTFSSDKLPDELLASSPCVHIGSIDEVPPSVVEFGKDFFAFLKRSTKIPVFPKCHRSETKLRHL